MLLNGGLASPKPHLLSETDVDNLPVGTKMMTLRGEIVTKKEEGWFYWHTPSLECRLMVPITEYNPFVVLSTPKAEDLQTKFRMMELPLMQFRQQELIELEQKAFMLGMHLDMGKTRFSFSWERALRLHDRATVYVGTRDHIMFAYKDGLKFHWPDKGYKKDNQSYYVLQAGANT